MISFTIKKGCLLALMFSVSSVGLKAQSEKLLEKLAAKAKYEKLITKSEKRISKGQRDAISYYFLTKGFIGKAGESSGKVQERNFYMATKKYLKYTLLADSLFIYSDLDSLIHNQGKIIIGQLSERKVRRKKYYAEFLAENFNDTTSGYYELFAVKGTTKSETEEEALAESDIPDYSNVAKIQKQAKGFSYKLPEALPSGDLIVKTAEKAIGTPWVWAGMELGKGFDCSGFVIWAYGQFGYELPHMTKMLASIGKPVSREDIQVSDLVCFGSGSYNPKSVYHIGIIHSVNDEEIQIIHCGTSKGVSIVPLSSGYWSRVDHFIVRLAD